MSLISKYGSSQIFSISGEGRTKHPVQAKNLGINLVATLFLILINQMYPILLLNQPPKAHGHEHAHYHSFELLWSPAWLSQRSCALCSLLPPPICFQTVPRLTTLKHMKYVIAQKQGLTPPREIPIGTKALSLRQSILPKHKTWSPGPSQPKGGPMLPHCGKGCEEFYLLATQSTYEPSCSDQATRGAAATYTECWIGLGPSFCLIAYL